MTYEIVGDRLKVGGSPVAFVPANSSGSRMAAPSLIVLHDTADRAQPKDTVNWFASKQCTVSAHFVVERDGSITQMVECDQKAFHAGKSSFNGRSGCNNFAIGIEIDNPGMLDQNGRAWFHKKGEAGYSGIRQRTTKEHGAGWWLPYTDAQVNAVGELCRALIKAYPSITDIGTHWIISPGRKIDTNPLFPLEEVRAAAFKRKKAPTAPPPEPAVAALVIPAADAPARPADIVAVSRKAKTLNRFKLAMHSIWASLGVGSFLEWLGFAKGTMDQVGQFVQQHAIVLIITSAILAVLIVKYVLSLMAEDVNEGRYTPSGETAA